MNFIRYDKQTGDIVAYGFIPDSEVQREIDAGNPTLFTGGSIDVENYRVNLETKTLERTSPMVIPPDAFPDLN